MQKYIAFVLKNPITSIITIVIITALLFMGIPKLVYDSSMDVMMPRDDKEYVFYQKTQDIYGNTGRYIIMDVFSDDNLWSQKSFREIDNLICDIEEYKDFNKDIEEARIKSFDSFLSGNGVKYDELIEEYNNDKCFQRQLKRKIERKFGGTDKLNINNLKEIKEELLSTYSIKKGERIDRIISPFTIQDIVGEEDTLKTYDLIEKDKNGKRILPKNEEEFNKLRKNLLKTPFFEKGIYSRNSVTGEITDFAILVRFKVGKNFDRITGEIWDISKSYEGIKILSSGVPVVNHLMNEYMNKDLKTFFFPILIIVIIVFYLNFKSVRGIVLPFIILIVADIWILGLMGHLGYKITIVAVGLPSLMMAIGSSYSIHILNQYYIDFDQISEKGKMGGLKLSMSHISITVLLAGFTTFIGFTTLSTNQVSAIREWAVFSAIGVIFCVFVTITIIPAVFLLLPHKMPRIMMRKDKTVKKTMIDRIINIMLRIIIRHHKGFLSIVIIILIISIIGIFRLKVETAIFKYFKKDDYIRTSSKIIGQKFGGTSGLNILVDSGEMDGVNRPEFLKKIEDLREWLESDENIDLNVGSTDFYSDFIKKMNMVMNNDDISYYRIPDTYEDIADYLELYSGEDSDSDGRADEFESYVDPEFRTAHIFARLRARDGKTFGTAKLEKIISKMDKYLKEEFGDSYRITGGNVIFIQLAKYVVRGQALSLFLCLIVVGIIIILLFKNVFAGLIALIPMSVAVTINFGIMGWFGIDLDIATAIIASITIGIGVDDTIHFLNTFRHFRDKGFDIDETIEKTLSISGKAIIYTSLVLIFGFSVMMLSTFKPNMFFGFLISVTMIATTIGALVILPSTIKATGMSIKESESESFFWKYLYLGKLFGIEKD